MNQQNKYLDCIKERSIKAMAKHRLGVCPKPNDCYPTHIDMDKEGAGNCSGIVHSSNNLDCIKLCIFFEDLDTHKLRYTSHCMTPDEAVTIIASLSQVVRCSYQYNKSYQKLHNVLVKERGKIVNEPTEY